MQIASCKSRVAQPSARRGFTLFELILAIALSATLLALVGTAINLYLLRVDGSRTRVEEAQLARSILSQIAADVRATTMYQPQATSGAGGAAAFRGASGDGSGDAGPGGSNAGSTGGQGPGGSSGSGGSSSGVSSAAGTNLGSTQATTTGVNGNLNELVLDIARLPRPDELFGAAPAEGTTPVAPVATARPSDNQTIRYFVRQGATIADPSDPAATGLDPQAQLGLGGLVRQALDQAVRTAAESTGDTALLESGQVLLAPEVQHVEFRYFDGTAPAEEWTMQERQALPAAVEVRIWLTTAEETGPLTAPATSSGVMIPGTRMYSQTIALPLAGAASTTTSSTTTSGFGDTSGSF